MKVAVLLAYAVLTTRRVTCAAIQAPLEVVSLDDVTNNDRKALEFLNAFYNDPPRAKRSHEDSLQALKASIGQGIKTKLGLLAKGSASASSSFSKGSSGHSYHHHDEHPESHGHKSFDFWSLKKSILNTLLQAVKAIKGGVIAIKGQLIKGSGYLISAKGKLISAKGEAITNLGKNIATSAVLSPTHGHSEGYTHGHYHHSAPEEYGSPSAPGPEYDVPEHHYHHHYPHEDKPDADHAGILILKKIPMHDSHDHSEHLPVEHKIPEFKHIEKKGPSLGEIIGKFFSASTSLKPGVPAPFGDDDHHHDDDHHDHHHSDHSSHHHHDDDDHHDHHHSDHSSHHHHDDDHHAHHHSDHSSHEEFHHDEHAHSSHPDSHHEYPPSSHSAPDDHPGPFEKAPDFLNIAEYASETKGSLQTSQVKPTPEAQKLQLTPQTYDEVRPSFSNPGFDSPQAQKVQSTPQTYDEIRPLPSSFSNAGFDMSLLSHSQNSNLFSGSYPNNGNGEFSPFSVSLPSMKPQFAAESPNQFGAFQNTNFGSPLKYLTPPDVGPQIFPKQNYFDNVNSYPPYPQGVKNAFHDNLQSSAQHFPQKRPVRSKNNSSHNRQRYPPPAFMKSVMYELGPNGPKRL